MKNITVLIAGLMSSSLAFASGGVVDINAPFSVTAPGLCVPGAGPTFSFPSIDKQSTANKFDANRSLTLNIANCRAGTVILVTADSNMTAYDGKLVMGTVGDAAAGLIGAELFGNYSTASTVSSQSITNNPTRTITIITANTINLNAALKVKDANSLKTIPSAGYNISIPVTIAVR